MMLAWEYQIFKSVPTIEKGFIIILVKGSDLLMWIISSLRREEFLRNSFYISSYFPIEFGLRECNHTFDLCFKENGKSFSFIILH